MSLIYPWQQALWEQFQQMRTKGRIPHAILLTGQQGMGLTDFAYTMANTMLCQEKTAPCGQCQDCLLLEAHNHPDFLLVDTKKDKKDSVQITVDQIHKLISFTQLKSFAGHVKVSIIKHADNMNRYAANMLLKTLEDPPENTLFILVTQSPMRLPVTVRSRCQRFTMKPCASEKTLNWVRAQLTNSADTAQQALRLAGGAPLLAVATNKQEIIAAQAAVFVGLIELIEGKKNPVKLAYDWHTIGCKQVLSWLLMINHRMIQCKMLQSDLDMSLADIEQTRLQYHIKRLKLIQLVKSYEQIMRQYRLMLSPMNLNALGLLETLTIYWQSNFSEQQRPCYGE